jgi:hypothetical protein
MKKNCSVRSALRILTGIQNNRGLALAGKRALKSFRNAHAHTKGAILCLVSFACFSSCLSFATVCRVGPGPGYHYSTISAALAAADCDTILVAPGTYSVANGEAFPLRMKKGVTLQNQMPGTRPSIQGDKEHTVVLIETGGVSLRGFRITDGQGSEGINLMDGGGVCVFVGPSETNAVTIQDCVIENNTCPSDETYDGCGGGIYCGGTYCTCFEIRIADCVIRQNSVRGDGGGVFCALLSNVKIEDTLIEGNVADDHGGGVFVDVYAAAALTNTRPVLNNCPGDPQKANWGGKGGGLACESYGLFTATNCLFAQNTAEYFGGGIFTRGGLFEGEGLCGGSAQFPQVSHSLIASNRAESSGGGVYVASSGVLEFSATTNYWNNAAQDGGGVYVAGTGTGGGEILLAGHCLLEGNECVGRGGGVFLGPASRAALADTRLLGNSSLGDGGALLLDASTAATLTNCLLTHNNAARGYGGGLRLLPGANALFLRCSVVGNFALWGRSGLVLSTNATVVATNSILWRNAGGSIQTNDGNVQIAFSLIDSPDPLFVGWGTKSNLYVNLAVTGPGSGTAADPYRDLQIGLAGFDFRLATNSPCIGTASDGGNLGADTGVGGTSGNITATLCLTNGLYDIRGRNIIFTRGVLGAGATNSLIRHAVFGYVEDTFIRDLGITAEEIFGGIVVRANVRFENCRVAGNTAGTSTAGADGGGIYVAEGHCRLTNSVVSVNKSWGNGGGLFLGTNVLLTAARSQILQNGATGQGGGCFASSMTTNSVTESLVAENSSTGYGAGLYLDVNSVSFLLLSQVSTNSALNSGGGIYVDGRLTVTNVDLWNNTVTAGDNRGGGINISPSGEVAVFNSRFFTNSAGWHGGGINSHGKLTIHNSEFEANHAYYGGAIHFWEEPAGPGYCSESQFRKNNAGEGGARNLNVNTAPVFSDCEFVENKANYGGAGICWWGTHPTFAHCHFKGNGTYGGQGGSLYLCTTGSRFLQCMFSESSAVGEGGVAYFRESDASLFEDCYTEKSVAGTSGGAFCIDHTALPVFSNVQIVDSRAAIYGGGIAIMATAGPKFTDLSISNAQAVYGGGVFAGGQSQSLFQQCEFRNNRAYELTTSADGGGAFFTESASGWFSCCVFQGNTAQDDGGGMGVAENARVEVRNTLLAGNSAVDDGGGIHFTSQGAGTFTNCTIVSNTAIHGGTGGGLYMETNSTVHVDSSIVWQNSPDGIRRDATPSVSYSCVQEAWPGPGNLVTNPMLDPVTFALQDGSPCIDAGNPDPAMNDACRPPGKGGPRNDMGFTGGPDNCVAAYQGQFDFPSFCDPRFLVLRGAAVVTNCLLRLTEAQPWQVGGAWYAFPVYVRAGFETTFDFQIDRDGADGFAFVVQNASLAALGGAGADCGYSIPNSIAVEFDTFANGWSAPDPNDNHLSVQTRGAQVNSPDHTYSLGSTVSIPFLSDNQVHRAKVAYLPGQLRVFVDDMTNAALHIQVDLENALSLTEGHAFVGFTAGTGGLMETHDILRWSFVTASVLAPHFDLAQHTFRLSFYANLGRSYTLLGSTNVALPLAQWPVLTNWMGNGGVVEFVDPSPTNLPARFYLLRTP